MDTSSHAQHHEEGSPFIPSQPPPSFQQATDMGYGIPPSECTHDQGMHAHGDKGTVTCTQPDMQAGMYSQQPGIQPGMYPQPGMQPVGYIQPGMQPGMYPQSGMQPGMYPQPGMQPGMYPQPGMQPGMYPQPGMQPGMYMQPGMVGGYQPDMVTTITGGGMHPVTIYSTPVTQADRELASSILPALLLAMFVFLFCGVLFGLIAFMLAMVATAKVNSRQPDEVARYRKASFGVSIAGIIIGIIIIVTVGTILGLAAQKVKAPRDPWG